MDNCKDLKLTTASVLEIRSLISGKSIISWNTATTCVMVVKTKKVSTKQKSKHDFLCVTAIPFIDTFECVLTLLCSALTCCFNRILCEIKK